MESTSNGNVVIFQKLRKVDVDLLSKAERYYSILSAVNGLHFTEREIQLIAFAAVRGNISYGNIRKDFCEKYKTSSATINNIISKLKKINVLVKEGGKVKVNNVILLDFTKDVKLEIALTNG